MNPRTRDERLYTSERRISMNLDYAPCIMSFIVGNSSKLQLKGNAQLYSRSYYALFLEFEEIKFCGRFPRFYNNCCFNQSSRLLRKLRKALQVARREQLRSSETFIV
jgi:hypothetical protein